MTSTTTDPLPAPPAVSKKTITMAGLLVDVYGLAELSSPVPARQITCLWLHHPRGQAKETMADFASRAVSAWAERRFRDASSFGPRLAAQRGLVALAFDQRNHGTRTVCERANGSWRAGNATHAQDMMGAIRGMVEDTRGLMDLVEGYLGVEEGVCEGVVVDGHYVLGKSLGGHSAWQLMFADERVTAGVVIIGCPDYMALLSDRARRSKLSTFSKDDDGASFLGSRDFPKDLVSLCRRCDPKGILFGTSPIAMPTEGPARETIRGILDSTVRGKKFLVCSGADDKLVPYRMSEPFMAFFQEAARGWYKDGAVAVEDKVYEGVGHDFSDGMVRDALRFFMDALEGKSSEGKPKI